MTERERTRVAIEAGLATLAHSVVGFCLLAVALVFIPYFGPFVLLFLTNSLLGSDGIGLLVSLILVVLWASRFGKRWSTLGGLISAVAGVGLWYMITPVSSPVVLIPGQCVMMAVYWVSFERALSMPRHSRRDV